MKYFDIAPPFFEENRQFFEDIVTNSEHGLWSTRNLFDDFACLMTARHIPAFISNGQLYCHADKPYWFHLEFWSLSRNFAPNESFDDEDVDIFVNAYWDSDGKWDLFGEVRWRFLGTKAGATLKQELLNARMKSVTPLIRANLA